MHNLFADSSEVSYVKIRLIYVNTSLFTLLYSDVFLPSRRHPYGVLIRLVSRVNKILVQM